MTHLLLAVRRPRARWAERPELWTGRSRRDSYDGRVASQPVPGASAAGRSSTAAIERTLRRISVGVLLAFLVIVALITLTPGPPDPDGQRELVRWLAQAHRGGFPLWITYDLIEFSANVVMFLPLGLFAALALPSGRRWLAMPIGMLLSVGIESAQAAGLPGRFASVSDVVANTSGAILGYLLARLVLWLLRRRPREQAPAPSPTPTGPGRAPDPVDGSSRTGPGTPDLG